MVRTQHQQLNHQQCRKLGAAHNRRFRIWSALNEPKSRGFIEMMKQAVKLHIFNPYKQPKQPKNYFARKV